MASATGLPSWLETSSPDFFGGQGAVNNPWIGAATYAGNPFFGNLQNMGKNYFDFGGQTTPAFQNLIGSIQGQDQSVLDPLLKGVDTSTEKNMGDIQSVFAERGFAGPGQASGMEASALNEAGALGTTEKEGIQSNFLQNKANELTGAYGSAYGAANQGAGQAASIFNSLLGQSAQMPQFLAQMLQDQSMGRQGDVLKQDLSGGGDPSFWDRISGGFADKFGSTAGQSAGNMASALPMLFA
jgi:hypothetical protein